MGGGNYERDDNDSRSTNRSSYNTQSYVSSPTKRTPVIPERMVCDPILDIKGKVRECFDIPGDPDGTPIVLLSDITKSRGKDIDILWEKMPMFIGKLIQSGYVVRPVVSVGAIGDASDGDKIPLQVGQFETKKLDTVLKAINNEEAGGGGSGEESYELGAYAYARHTELDANKKGRKGYLFIYGDESPYPKVKKDQVKALIGDDIPDDIDTKTIFAELQQKFHVFLIFIPRSVQEKKKDIDAEIKKRVESAGGQYENVDIRASLMWNTTDDLDLHMRTPGGDHIYFSTPHSSCGGALDVDKNASTSDLTEKPVENIRWKKKTAKAGHYEVFVQNFCSRSGHDPIKYTVTVEINGEITHYSGEISRYREKEASNQTVVEFDYDPTGRKVRTTDYSKYEDAEIIRRWSELIPPSHILQVETEIDSADGVAKPKGIMDATMGAIALMEGISLDQYRKDMALRDQSPERIEIITKALTPLAGRIGFEKADVSGTLPVSEPGNDIGAAEQVAEKKTGGMRRL